MKKKVLSAMLIAAVVGTSTLTTSCIGSFNLTNKLLSWNKTIGNKFVNELVFVCFWILPVYEVSGLCDILVLNSIEFWSGSNPVAKGEKVIEGQDGRYLVKCDGKGYDITGPDGLTTRLDFDADRQEWSTYINDEKVVFLGFVDDTHVRVPAVGGGMKIVEMSQDGLYAYRQEAAMHSDLAMR